MESFASKPSLTPLSDKKRTVVIIATLDTRASAAKFLRDEIAAWGLNTTLIDPGILGAPGIQADVTRWQVAEAAGTTLEALLATGEQSICIEKQTEGLCSIVQKLYNEGKLDGIISLGGSQGTSIGTAAMRSLPVGVPKLMLSTIETGMFQLRAYIGSKDICIMHSVADILDVNAISRPILHNAVNAIAGMVLHSNVSENMKAKVIGITQLGRTAPCVMRVKRLLEPQGYQIVPFDASGFGGPAMEDLIQAGRFTGVIDLSIHEIIDNIFHGIGGAKYRLEALTRTKIPAIISVGGSDYLLFESVEKAPEKYRQRRTIVDNPQITVFQPSVDEMESAARYMLDPLNRALGPTMVLIPAVGFSDMNHPGRELWFPEGNLAASKVLQDSLRPEVPVIVVDAHINQPVFADVIAVCMSRLLAGEDPRTIATRYRFE
jgi:uncharacterized protein (UPF0261 family)